MDVHCNDSCPVINYGFSRLITIIIHYYSRLVGIYAVMKCVIDLHFR